ncbi:MAG: flagellar hook-length control protein FliK [Deltaproteobacteria bacterium]|jgi:hypothetical protein|nr:flagellar hook-length control protein FliK [Deltaproteobacteria bacterium]
MLDSLSVNSVAPEYATSVEASARTVAVNFENGAEDDFQRILDRADSYRQEAARAARARRDEPRPRGESGQREDLTLREGGGAAGEEILSYGPEARAGSLGEKSSAAFDFKADRARGQGLAYARIQAETLLPGGFRRRVSQELLLSGNMENALSGLYLGDATAAAGVLKDALEGVDGNLALFTLGEGAYPALANILAQSGVDGEKIAGFLSPGGVAAEIKATDLLKFLATQESGASLDGQSLGDMTATSEGLNNLGQFLLGLGFSPETIKAVTSGASPGSILPASSLRDLITAAAGAENLSPLITEGDLSFLALALQSMGAGEEAVNGINLLLKGSGGELSLGGLLDFLATLDKPRTANPQEMAADIQTVLRELKSQEEIGRPILFNEVIIKLSLLGDREMDRNFYELSPALQALRGGVSALRDGAAGGNGDFSQGGGQRDGESRREREERRALAGASGALSMASPLSGATGASLYDEVAGYGGGETLARQLKEKLVYGARAGIRRLKMSLNPESLGRLDVELRVKGNKLTANVKAESLEAYNALEKEVAALREALGEEGLELKLTLSFSGENPRREFFAGGGDGLSGDGPEESADMGEARMAEGLGARARESGAGGLFSQVV